MLITKIEIKQKKQASENLQNISPYNRNDANFVLSKNLKNVKMLHDQHQFKSQGRTYFSVLKHFYQLFLLSSSLSPCINCFNLHAQMIQILFCIHVSIQILKKLEEMRKNIISPFIELIWNIVEDPTNDHIISWSPNGTSFLINDQQAFSNEMLSKHFKHGNLSSFIRQLNMYNFHKNKNNSKQLQFFHKLFRRGAKELLIGIKRKPSEADQREGQQLLRQFLYQKQATSTDQKSCKDSDHFEEDKTCENTTIQAFMKKSSLIVSESDKMEYSLSIPQLPPRLVLNIILINKPEDLVI